MPLSLTDLPYTIFTTIIAHLSPTQTIRCRLISRAFHSALTRNDLCISLILAHFPRSLEGRRLKTHLKTGDLTALESGDWAAVFANLARRYYHLGNALPWKIDKVKVFKDDEGVVLRGVAPWNRHLSLNGKTAAFHFWDPAWTVAPGEGLLVYPAEEDATDNMSVGAVFRARDLQTGREVDVPFDLRGKIVRRVRVSHGVLVFEWCEQEALSYNNPLVADEAKRVHRHYATAYSVRTAGSWDGVIPRRHVGGVGDASSETPAYTWEFELRCEFEIHPVGLSLNHQDRFFSTHNATHYVPHYLGIQPSPAAIRNNNNNNNNNNNTRSKHTNPSTPRIIRTMTNRHLRDSALRQGHAPALRAMALDDSTWDPVRASACGHVFLTEEEHRWSAGPHSSPNRPRLHRVKTTGIPLVGQGPRWVDDCGGGGGVNLRFCWRGRWRRDMTEVEDDGVVLHDDGDDDDGGSDGAVAWSPERAWSHSQTWPGRAPCWRHDDFPYVTLSEVFDAAAGVRVIARDCFMLETLSVHIRPKIRVQGVGSNGAKLVSRRASSGTDSKTTSTMSSAGANHPTSRQTTPTAIGKSNSAAATGATAAGTTTEGPDGHEVQFADAMWSEMMAKGFICGDERWLVGEDSKGDVTILVF
ncbi:hypothetical protein CCMA1212_002710 [Trichoderma ghanense]|uniref:F-box domain-containing protein n=1 Tax=Trichoderma ghanense TaxID=65468 RepID=A0ABY2HBQ1_9HYPO